MNDRSLTCRLSLVASQIEAASSLLKFATDDLSEIMLENGSIFAKDIAEMVKGLELQTAVLDGQAAFILRTDLCGDGAEDAPQDGDEGAAGDGIKQWMARL